MQRQQSVQKSWLSLPIGQIVQTVCDFQTFRNHQSRHAIEETVTTK